MGVFIYLSLLACARLSRVVVDALSKGTNSLTHLFGNDQLTHHHHVFMQFNSFLEITNKHQHFLTQVTMAPPQRLHDSLSKVSLYNKKLRIALTSTRDDETRRMGVSYVTTKGIFGLLFFSLFFRYKETRVQLRPLMPLFVIRLYPIP